MSEENSTANVPTITITMVGPTRVGKTSLLAAMYGELEKEMLDIGCTFTMEAGPTTKSICERLDELESLASGSGMKVQAGEGIQGGVEKREYVFDLDVGDGGAPEVRLRFVDLPGGWYTGDGSYQEADTELGKSSVSLLAVDAVALMESNGCFHKKINAPLHIKESYKRALKNLSAEHLIIITLIRSETYIKNGREKELIKKVKEEYAELTKYLKKDGQQIAVYACLVETVGGLVFHKFNLSDTDELISVEYRRLKTEGYSPKKCALPLRIAAGKGLQHALDEAIKEEMIHGTLWANIIAKLGFDTALARVKKKKEKIYQALEKIRGNINENDYHQIHS